MMAAKKKGGANPALFATGIAQKGGPVRGGGRKPLKATTFKGVALGAAAGTYTLDKPWLRGQKAEQAKVSKFQQLAGSLGSKEGRGGGAGIFFLVGSRSRK